MSDRTEKLKIVFSVEAIPGAEVRLGDREFRQLTPAGGIGDGRILHLLIETMKRFSIPLEFKHRDGKAIPVGKFAKRLESQGKWGGSVEAGVTSLVVV